MVAIAQRRCRIRTIDFQAGTTIVYSILSQQNVQIYIHMASRFMWSSGHAVSTIHWFDPQYDPPRLISGFATTGVPVGIWGDNRYLWTIDSIGIVRQIDPQNQSVVGSFTLLASTYTGLSGDGRYLWTIDSVNLLACQIDPNKGTIVGTFTVAASPNDLHHDGRFLFVFTGNASQQGRIRQYDPNNGSPMGSILLKTYTSLENGISLTGNSRFLYATEIEEF